MFPNTCIPNIDPVGAELSDNDPNTNATNAYSNNKGKEKSRINNC